MIPEQFDRKSFRAIFLERAPDGTTAASVRDLEVSALPRKVEAEAHAVVTTGTCLVPLEIQPGDRVAMDFGPLGHVEARLGDR